MSYLTRICGEHVRKQREADKQLHIILGCTVKTWTFFKGKHISTSAPLMMKDDMVFALICTAARCLLELHTQCDVEQLDDRWHLILSLSKLWSEDSKRRRCSHNSSSNITVMWKRSIWLLHHWAEGALSKMNAEVLATKLTLTCQINSISREKEREMRKGSSLSFFFDKCCLMMTKTAQTETGTCC